MPLAQLVNNCQGPHYIQRQREANKADQLLVIQPGINLVDAKLLTEIKKNPGVARLFDARVPTSKAEEARDNARNFGKPMLEVRGKELEDKAPLNALPLKEAQEIISMTEDTDLLKSWMDDCVPSKQADLIRAIGARMKEVTSGIVAE